MKVLFVRPPRYSWPMNSESSSFWQPLGFASMAAVLREHDYDVEILDCLPLRMGWKTLAKVIEMKKPDVIGLGDEMASAIESIKLAKLAKQIDSNVKVVGGGFYFSFMDNDSILNKNFDFIARGEGEITMLELMNQLKKRNPDFSKIDGLSYRKNDKVMRNKERKLISDLDSLPLPAYDLLPMERYGADSTNHKYYSAIEHGRGCVNSCTFCSVWKLMSNSNKACYRTKSAEKSYEETELLVKKYRRKTLNWTDGTYNADVNWNREYTQLLLDNNVNVKQTTWMRSDLILRDEKQGILKKMVDAGLVQTVIGVERVNDTDLKNINKNNSFAISQRALKILRKYKKVYSIASFIYGMPDETKKSLSQLNRIVHSSFADMVFLLPYTPYPGTKIWEKVKDNLEEKDFTKYNLHLPVMSSKYMSRNQLNRWFKSVLFWYVFWPDQLFKRIILEGDARKRKVQISLASKILKMTFVKAFNTITFQKGNELEYGIKPGWYDT